MVSAPAATAAGALDIPSLTRGMVHGEELAFRTFYEHYYPRLWRYLLVVAAGDEEMAREALQATFIRVVRHAKVWPDEPSFWGWLTVLARSAHSDHSRKQRRYLAFLERFSGSPTEAPAVAGDPDLELVGALRRNLVALPAEERDLIEQKYFESQPVRKIADAMGTSEKAIESRLSRIRRKLKMEILEALKHE